MKIDKSQVTVNHPCIEVAKFQMIDDRFAALELKGIELFEGNRLSFTIDFNADSSDFDSETHFNRD